jgi:hypothetical protein
LHKFLHWLRNIIGALVIGVLGSALWEKVVSPGFTTASAATVSFFSGISDSYQDSIYQRAARDVPNLYAMKIAFLILFMAGAVLLVPHCSRWLEELNLGDAIKARLRGVLRMNAVSIGIALLAMSFFSISKVTAAADIKGDSLRSMEMARSKIGETEYIRLRSLFYSINNKADFLAFKASLDKEAQKYNIANLPINK